MIRPILSYDNPILRAKTPLVTAFDTNLKAVAQDLLDTHKHAEALGIACPQIGYNIRMFISDVHYYDDFEYSIDGKKPPYDQLFPLICINPEILKIEGPEYNLSEGCLSLPDIRVTVDRPENITAQFQDLEGNTHLLICTGIFARNFQHELDHLNGILTIDRMDKREFWKVESKLKKLRREARAATKKLKK